MNDYGLCTDLSMNFVRSVFIPFTRLTRPTRRLVCLTLLLVGAAACTAPSNLPQGADTTRSAMSSPLASPLATDVVAAAIPPANALDQALALAPKDAPKPDAGKASISGLVYSPSLSMGVMKTGFYLTKALGENNHQISPILIGPDETKGDVRGITDKDGTFSVNNLEPGNYFIVLSAPNDWVPFERDGTSGAPRLIELKADQQLALGLLYVPWP